MQTACSAIYVNVATQLFLFQSCSFSLEGRWVLLFSYLFCYKTV